MAAEESTFEMLTSIPASEENSPEGTNEEWSDSNLSSDDSTSVALDDFTAIPKILDAKFEEHDDSGALKSTIIKAGSDWIRSRQENLLVSSQTKTLDSNTVTLEKNKAMDLLIAISRSGSLPIESSELHVIVAVSHCFENQIMETIIEDNINPIEKMEKSMMMIGSVIHGVDEMDLVGAEKKEAIGSNKTEATSS